jgi:hypothetical protein
MTFEEKMEMYRSKKRFIENLNEVFQMEPKCGSVEGVTYEVYTKDFGEGRVEYREWVVVHFVGGGKSPRLVSGNSNTANFAVIGQMLNGGYYTEVQDYETQVERGYTVVIPVNESKLDQLLRKPMKHIRDVEACFEYCTDEDDVNRVLEMIPNMFGTFDVTFDEDGVSFAITNNYDDDGDWVSEEYQYDYYTK